MNLITESWNYNLYSQEKEYKEALDAFNAKSKEKAQLLTKLMEVISFSFLSL